LAKYEAVLTAKDYFLNNACLMTSIFWQNAGIFNKYLKIESPKIKKVHNVTPKLIQPERNLNLTEDKYMNDRFLQNLNDRLKDDSSSHIIHKYSFNYVNIDPSIVNRTTFYAHNQYSKGETINGFYQHYNDPEKGTTRRKIFDLN
jgi:hypothetical protein